MSFNNPPGASGGMYVPPPPPPVPVQRARSPWLYVGLGCGLLTLLIVGGCIAAATLAVRRATEENKKPVTQQQVVADLKPIPIYPGSKVDLETSRALRAGASVVNVFVKTKAGAFRVPASSAKVIAWYETKMSGDGWRSVAAAPRGFGGSTMRAKNMTQRQFLKNDKQVLVQSGESEAGAKTSRLTLFVISGMPQQP